MRPSHRPHTLNIGILAHVDAGKTSLTERLLFDSGAIDRLGSVDAGDTRTDDGAIERQRGITIRSAVAAFTAGDTRINLIDTPGHSDFIAEVERALEVLDGAVLLLSAVEGVQAQTRVLMRTLRRLRLPTLVFVNKIDRAGARSDALLTEIRRRLTPYVVPLSDVDDAGTPAARVRPRPLTAAATAEAIAEADPAVLAALVDGPAPTPDELDEALAARTADGSLHPLLFGSALGGQGVPELVLALTRLVPRPAPTAADAPPRGTVFAVRPTADGARTAYLRLYEGEVTERQRLTFLRREADGRTTEVPGRVTGLDVIGHQGPLTAGNIAALTGFGALRVGDRLGELASRAPQFAPPSLETLVRARHPEQSARLRSALLALADQDPLTHARPAPDGSTALLLYGEVQKEVLAATLAQDFGIEAEFEPSRVRFLERPAGTGEASEENPWLDRGHCFATVGLRVEQGTPGSGAVFTYETELGALPRAFHQAIEDTVHASLLAGPHGWPVTDCRVVLVRSGFVGPLSTAADFRALTPVVLRRALERAGTRVYEPYHAFELEIPSTALAPVTGLLASLGAEFGRTTGIATGWRLTGELGARRVREAELRLPGLTHGEGVWWSRVSGDRALR
ncbi:tetracycline resistance ribosomal protection protein Otr(A) [Streptomyces turgidiscabies]|uniref:Putative tetracycline resistance protein TetP n=1 Tax=Streptomyces turgidiscabies (strain Car8) TaxID=698760 RepID=L7EY82_STRT8|nr:MULTISPECIES: tetracycline resistance ribosomal protection protein Otr(A) [Streptomyces]ELP64388.1 putative tetracycline resistance protein TetP [Streptomyces turgidiscabies Car8]MDX3491801.1 tetracycline resistance ribosomal protection protein Otr(A) [Streptomyces turgidiscabies]GAQ72083.1 tetracycline resistance protein TetM from [Streptomyces turgidiscabies]